MKKFFKFKLISEERIVELFNIEPELMNYLDAKKPFNIRVMPDHFQCFVHTVISQQLSSAAVDTIWNRMILNFKTITPKIIANASKETLSVIGLSPQKIGLIKQVSYDILDKKLNLKKLGKKNNNEISEILTKYKYLGQWTVDMLLIFTYYRNNILPNDYGVIMGMRKVYGIDEIDEAFLNHLRLKLKEYATLFTFCMWSINKINKNTK